MEEILEVVSKDDIPIRPRTRFWIPLNPKVPEKILRLIKMCNPKVSTHNWKIAMLEERHGSRFATIIVNQ